MDSAVAEGHFASKPESFTYQGFTYQGEDS